ncbi:putative quinol monooxygenase [Halostella sp. PRR32]|uniref:putative quinol monooxygenase n=1 Tax=Halostella sp. PRR32 TaxID=3098147 RepID=UPI00110DE375|nr:putative quinol monooxygenase [Halostella sp. PRR32]
MITVHSSIPIDPDHFDEAKELIATLTERSRAEDGTVRYRAMIDIEDSTTVRFFEQYEDKAAWKAHTESKHYEEFTSKLPDLVDGRMETINVVDGETHVHRFTVEDLDENSS